MFLGEYQHTIDEKGRLVLPSKFRHRLAEGVVVTKGQEHCLYVFPMDGWDTEVERVRRLSRENKVHRTYLRAFFGSASDLKPDRQGRIAPPSSLRSYAGLDRDVVVVGMADHLEIWDASAWAEVSSAADAVYSDIEEALTEEGI